MYKVSADKITRMAKELHDIQKQLSRHKDDDTEKFDDLYHKYHELIKQHEQLSSDERHHKSMMEILKPEKAKKRIHILFARPTSNKKEHEEHKRKLEETHEKKAVHSKHVKDFINEHGHKFEHRGYELEMHRTEGPKIRVKE